MLWSQRVTSFIETRTKTLFSQESSGFIKECRRLSDSRSSTVESSCFSAWNVSLPPAEKDQEAQSRPEESAGRMSASVSENKLREASRRPRRSRRTTNRVASAGLYLFYLRRLEEMTFGDKDTSTFFSRWCCGCRWRRIELTDKVNRFRKEGGPVWTDRKSTR